MNLELLDPFDRQVPDRVDSTLPLAPHLHFQQANRHLTGTTSNNKKDRSSQGATGGDGNNNNSNRHWNTTNVNVPAFNVIGSGLNEKGGTVSGATGRREFPEWRAAYHLSYNRRGTELAVGYGSGAVAVHSTSSRTLSALYRSDAGMKKAKSRSKESEEDDDDDDDDNNTSSDDLGDLGVTSVSWSRRSRTLLAGAAGQDFVHVHDTTHPYGPEEAGLAIDSQGGASSNNNNDGEEGNNNARGGNDSDKALSQKERNYQIGISPDDGFNYIPPYHSRKHTGKTQFADPSLDETKYIFVKDPIQLEAVKVPMGTRIPQHVKDSFKLPEDSETEEPPILAESDTEEMEYSYNDHKKKKKKKKRKKKESLRKGRDRRLTKHPCVKFSFTGQGSVGGSLQINPRCPTGGLAALTDGTLVLFWFDRETSWLAPVEPKETADTEEQTPTKEEGEEGSAKKKKKRKVQPKKFAIVVPLWNQTSRHFITCAAFDPQGERVYAATKDGVLMGFEVKLLFESLMAASPNSPTAPVIPPNSKTVVDSPIKGGLPLVAPHFKLRIPGGASAWHLLVSRNGKSLVLNSSDGALRLYSTETCWTYDPVKSESKIPSKSGPTIGVMKPTQTFQDVVSKVKFVSCDLSGDGEYVVGGANGNDNRYELTIWNASTGTLQDKLTGPNVQLYSLAWHPTRAHLAVATSDGLVDVWGPKMGWTAFAPDFQALHKNVIYKDEEENGDLDNAGSGDESDAEAMDIDTKNEQVGSGSRNGNEAGAEEKSAKKAKKDPSSINQIEKNDEDVDVMTVAPIPVFASDSEDEAEAFAFETRVKNLFLSRINTRNSKGGADKNDD